MRQRGHTHMPLRPPAIRHQWQMELDLTDIYVDGDACPVREEIYRLAARLRLNVFVVSNGSRPMPPNALNVRMVLVGDSADAADYWIAEHISAVDVMRHF
jgi:uncharacterized protein